jgi:hypothetical protein
VAFNNARTMIFFLKWGRLPLPISTSPEKLIGGTFNVPPSTVSCVQRGLKMLDFIDRISFYY